MSTNQTKVATIKELLAEIALHDLEIVAATGRACDRMAKLGLSPTQVRGFLDAEPLAEGAADDGTFHGFASRYQASLAALSGLRKADQPAVLGAIQDRVNTLIKVQVPEKASQTIGIAVVSIPAQQAIPAPEEKVMRFRRLHDGRMKEITGKPADFMDVEAEPASESTFTVKRVIQEAK